MKQSQKTEIEDLKKKHVDMARLIIMLTGYYTHLEEKYDEQIKQQDIKIKRLESLVQKLMLTR